MRKAYAFDFDETLVKTDAKINVYKHGAFHMSLDSKEFNKYVPKRGETLDFSDFNNPEFILKARPYKMWPVIRNVSNAVKKDKSNSTIYIITARSVAVKSYIYEFLKDKGIDIGIDHIITVGDDTGKISISEEKRKQLKKLALRYDEIIFFDDDPKNIAIAAGIKNIKVRLVENINKFREDSDPIYDMGIGMEKAIKDWVDNKTIYLYDERELLCICVEYGKVDFVKYLLNKGYDVHYNNDYALRLASENGRTKIVKLLLDAGADVRAANDYALRKASENGHVGVVKLLLDAGTNIHAANYAASALYWAIDYDNVEILKLLQDYNAKENNIVKESITHFREDSDPIDDMGIGMDKVIKDWAESEIDYIYNKNELLWVSAKEGKVEFVKYLLNKGYDVHYSDDYALRLASENGHVEIVKLLLDAGSDVHAANDHALRLASTNGHTEVVKILLDAGANVHANNDVAIYWAAKHGYVEIVKLFQDHIAKEKKIVKESITHFREDSDPLYDMGIGMDAAIKDWIDNETAYDYKKDCILWVCAKYGKVEFVKYLLKKGHDPNELAGAPLRTSSEQGNVEIVKILIDAHADIHIHNDTPLRIASYYGHDKVVKLLLDAGANVHANKDWALREASKNGHIKVVKLLIDAGAYIHTNDYEAIRLAEENGCIGIVELLKKHSAKSMKEDMGGVSAPMSTLGNVPGMGSPMTAQPGGVGSGDNWAGSGKPYTQDPSINKKKKKTKKKVVKESITHFREDSDPVHDMGIGMDAAIKDWIENETNYEYKKDYILWICAKYGEIEFVKYLLNKGHDPNELSGAPLRASTEQGITEIVKILIDAGADVHVYNDEPLRVASHYGYDKVVKLLLDAGANVYVNNEYPIRIASQKGHIEIVKLLLDAGADVHAEDDFALRWAKADGQFEVVELLQDHIAKEKKGIKESVTHFKEDGDPIHDMNIGMDSAIKDWVENETEHDYVEKDLLWICAKHNKVDFVKYLLGEGYDVHTKNDESLRLASHNGNFDVVKVLLDAGADVHAEDNQPLRLASQQGHVEVVKLLLDARANVHAATDAALCWASANGHYEVVKVLLNAGADVHARNNYALRYAAKRGHYETVKLLLDAGADVHANDDETLRWAKEHGHMAVVKLLKKHSAKSMKEDMGGVSAPMSTLGNVPGMGSPMTTQPGGIGSGDTWTNNKKPYTQAANPPKTKKKKRKTEKDDSKIVSETLQHFKEKVDPVKDMEIGKIKGLWDYTPEDAAIEVWAYMKPIVQRMSSQAKKFNRGYLIVPKNITTNGCNALGFEPDIEIFNYMVHLVAKEIEKSIKGGTIPLSNSVRYIPPLNEENINPYDKIGMAMAKKMKVKPPFKKVKSKKNQNAMKQQTFEHQIITLDEFLTKVTNK